MKKVHIYASGGELVIWCETCKVTLTRISGMQTIEYVVELANLDCNCERVKSEAGN